MTRFCSEALENPPNGLAVDAGFYFGLTRADPVEDKIPASRWIGGYKLSTRGTRRKCLAEDTCGG